MASPIRVLIADDQVLFAESLQYVLRGVSKAVEVVGIANDGAEAVSLSEKLKPDLILMDVRMPGMDGVEATKRIHEAQPDVRIVILTTFDDDEYVYFAVKYGAVGYLLKNIRPDDLVVSIQAVMSGATLFAPGVSSRFVDGDDPTTDEVMRLVSDLSPRERQALDLVMKMMNNRQIGEALSISEHSARNLVSSLYSAFGASGRLELIRLLADTWRRFEAES